MLKVKKEILNSNRFYRRSLIISSSFVLYLILSLLYFAPSSLSQLSSSVFNYGGDTQQFIWYYNWWPYALTHHFNPFISKYAWFPSGYNLSWSTSIPVLALIMMPITLMSGAFLSFNLVAMIAPALSAMCAFILIYYLTKKYLASWLGGYIYGFSSYELGQLLGHPGLYVTFLIPLLVLLYILCVKERIKPRTYIILTAVLLALEFGISLEIFATFIFFSLVSLIVIYFLHKINRDRLLICSKYSLYSLVLALALLSPYIYYLAIGYSNVPSVIHPISAFSTNAANFILPTKLTLIGGKQFAFLSNRFTANLAENGAYLGLPIFVLLAYIFFKYWRNIAIRTLSFILIILGIATLGPKLHLISQTGKFIPLPWVIFTKLPLIKSAQPDRLSLYCFLVAGIILALWLSLKASTKKKAVLKYASVIIAVIFLVPSVGINTWSKPAVPKVFQAKYVSQYIPKGSNLLILPFDQQGSGIYYQYASGMEFTQTGGYVGFVPRDYASDDVVKSLMSDSYPKDFSSLFKRFCLKHRINIIVYSSKNTNLQLVSAIKSYHWPEETINSSVLVRVLR